ncbi:MAG TPA: hypothetical protein VEI97_20260, partial [bacterium]|nr:hypothetical protein [bacterium]
MRHWRWLVLVLLVIVAVLVGLQRLESATAGGTSEARLMAAARRWQPDTPALAVEWRGVSQDDLPDGPISELRWLRVADGLLLASQGGSMRDYKRPFRLSRIHPDGTVQTSEPWGALVLLDASLWRGRPFLALEMKRHPGIKLMELDTESLQPASKVSLPYPPEFPQGFEPAGFPGVRFLGARGGQAMLLLLATPIRQGPPGPGGVRATAHHLLHYAPADQSFHWDPTPVPSRVSVVPEMALFTRRGARWEYRHEPITTVSIGPDLVRQRRVLFDAATGAAATLPDLIRPEVLPHLSEHPHPTGLSREDPYADNPGFFNPLYLLEPPISLGVSGEVPLPPGSRVPAVLQRPLLRARSAWRRVIPPIYKDAPLIPHGAELGPTVLSVGPSNAHRRITLDAATSGLAIEAARLGSYPYWLHALDSRTALLVQVVAPGPGLRRTGLLRFGTLTPPSTDITWWAHAPLPLDFPDYRQYPYVELHATATGWLAGIHGGRYSATTPDPKETPYRWWWTRIPYPAGWPYTADGRLGSEPL